MKACSIEKCESLYYSKGFCKKHYDSNRRHGDPNFVKEWKKDKPCQFVDCRNPVISNSLCAKHNRKMRRTGTLVYTNHHDGKAQERDRKRTAKWKKDNWDYYKAYLAARKERVKQATPPWADIKAIEKIYRECPKGYHVDHIEPLNGKDRSGLHVPYNLQYLPALENLKKSNKVS